MLLFLAANHVSGQRAVVIASWPANTPTGDMLYLAASANSWNPADEAWAFDEADGAWVLGIPAAAPNVFQGKVTRGSWATVEGSAAGGFLPNRNFDFGETDTVIVHVQSWEGMAPPPDDLPPNVVVMDEDFFMPELDRTRRVRLFLPSNYDSSDDHYPVLYMQDGQNLFSAQEAFAGEWEVDEAMLAFEGDGYQGGIIVAIDNGGAERINEYTPYANDQYGGGDGAAYSDFVAYTLKPYMDEHYRTLPARDHTGIMGSSLGGLISFYAAMAHQDVFSKVGVFSPSFWFSSEIYDFALDQGMQDDLRFFFLAGGQESANLDAQVTAMVDLLAEAGFAEDQLRYDFVPNGQHSEWFWAQEFPTAFEWLFMDDALSTSSLQGLAPVSLFPNPVRHTFRLRHMPDQELRSMQLLDVVGHLRRAWTGHEGVWDVSDLPPGLYLLRVETDKGIHLQKLVKK